MDIALSILYLTFAARAYDVEAAHILGYMYKQGMCSRATMTTRYD